MNTARPTLAILCALMVAGAGSLAAQRRTTGSGGSTDRSTPRSSGGSVSSGGRSEPARSGGGNSGSGASARPSSGKIGAVGSSGSSARGSGSGERAAASGSSGSGNAGRASGSGASSSSGKIGAVKSRAAAARRNTRIGLGGGVYVGSCWGCGWGWYNGGWGWYHGGWWYPAHYPRDYEPSYDERPTVSQGYLDYPYADDSAGTTFVRERAAYRHRFGAISVNGFSDVGSATHAAHLGFEGGIGQFHGQIEYGQYFEPVDGHTDRMHSVRLSAGMLPRLGDRAYLVAGVGVRGIILDDGSNAWGPEGEVGLQVFPARPFGATVTYRVAGLKWTAAADAFLLSELNTTASLFIGREEFQVGWHWLKLAGSPAFGGPTLGYRVWF